MKKLILFFLVFLSSSLVVLSAARSFSLVANNPTCGNQINVEVWVDNPDDLVAVQWSNDGAGGGLYFDSTIFSYSGYTMGPILTTNGWTESVGVFPNWINFAAAGLPIPSGSGSQLLASFTFDTLTDVCDGTPISFQLRNVLWSSTTESDQPGNDSDLNLTVSCPSNPQISFPSNPNPADGAINQPTTLTLNWDDSTGANTYDLYFGTTNPPPYYGTTSVSQYDVTGLSGNTQYFWYVVADNTLNTCPPATGPVWSFTTTTSACSVVAYGFDLDNSNLVWFDLSNPGTFNVVGSFGSDYPFGADFIGGDYSRIYAIDDNTNQFVAYSTTDASKTVLGSSTPNPAAPYFTGLAEHANGTVYAISTDCGSNTYLYTLNPANGATTEVGQVSGVSCAINLAADSSGNLYTLDIGNDNLYKIDAATAVPTLLGPVGFNANYAQGMDFDVDNQIMYMAAYNLTLSRGELRTVNLTNGSTTLVGAFQGDAEVDGISIVSCVGPPPPGAFNNIAPPDGSIDQPTNGLLIDWEDAPYAIYYDLYFGTTPSPPLFQSNLTSSQYTANGLANGTTYYWYVIAKNSSGTMTGAEWSFTTAAVSIPNLEYDSSIYTDDCLTGGIGDGDSVIDPGEDITIFVTLRNSGTDGATGVSAILSSTTPGVTVLNNSSNYPDIPASGTGTSITGYLIHLDSTMPCGTTIDLNLSISSNEGGWADMFQLSVGSTLTRIFYENFDGIAPPALPANWSSVVVNNPGGTTPAWATNAGTHHPSGTASHSAPNLVWFNSWHVISGKSARLQYNVPFDFSTYGSINIYFWMYHDIEYNTSNDYVQVQVSTDGGTSWADVGAPISRYDGTVQWTEHSVDLSAYAGQANVMIGILGVSAYGNDCHIDDISIFAVTSSPVCNICTPGTPNLSIQSTSFVDDCLSGGPGDGDSNADPGEYLDISPIIQNTGTAHSTGINASLSTTNPLVTIIVSNASYGDIPVGSFAPPATPFEVYLSETIPCGTTIDFTLNITSNEGSWVDTFQINVGGSGPVIYLLSEEFESWPPLGWTIVDEQPGWSCDVWRSTAYWGATNDTGGAGEAADADSDACGGGMDTSMITPLINLSGYASAILDYDCNFQDYLGNGDAWTDISIDGGATWTNLRYETIDDPSTGHHVTIDLTPYIGQTIQIKFHFFTPAWDWYWRIDNVYISVTTPVCNVCSCPLPDPFNLITPPDLSTNVPLTNVLFDWDDSAGATSYNFYLGQTIPPPLYQVGLATSQITVPSLSQNTTYYWYVDAVNICGTTSSAVWSFTTVCPVPGAFNLISPPNGTTGIPTANVLLDWQDSSGATSYNLYFGTNPTPLLYQSNILSSQFTIPSLSQSTTYYWRVEAVNACGTTSSSTWSFTTETGCIPPDPPQLISPPNGSTDLIPPIELVWSGSGADYYEVYLGKMVGYLDLIGTTTGTSFVVSNLEEGTTYYWVINAVNSCGNASSEAWHFTTAGAPPVEEYNTIIPAVASAEGARSSLWKTDVQIFNPTEKTISYTMYFIPPDTDGTQTPYQFKGTIEPKKLAIFNDIVKNTFGLSHIVGGIQIVSNGNSISTARTYNRTELGTYGQFVKGYDVSSAIGKDSSYFVRQNEVGHIFHLINSISFRTNVGFMEVKGEPVEALINIYDNENNLLGSGSYNLQPKGFLQVNDIFNNLGISGFKSSARAEIKINGDGALFAYASVVDNYSNDAIFVPLLKEEGNLQNQSIAVAANKEGDRGTFWKSDLRIFNPKEEAQDVTINFVEKGNLYTKTVEVEGKNIIYTNDLIEQFFGLTDNVGEVQIIAPEGVLATSRIYTSMEENMTYGQFVPSTLIQGAIGINQEQYILHLASNESFRTNIGISEITGSPATVEIKLYSSDGNELASGMFNLSGNEFKQINRIFEIFNIGNVNNGYAKVKVLSGNGSVLVYGSVVDNYTGDAIYVIGQ